MSSDNDKCFQCQETGHMTCYCPHIRCFDCNNYGHVTVDWPDKIPPSGTPARHRDNITSRHDRSASWNHSHTRHSNCDHRTDTDSVNIDLTHITLDIGVTVTATPAEVILDHFTGTQIIVLHATGAQAHTTNAKTHHITDPHYAGISPETTVDPEHINPTNTTTNPHKDLLPVHMQHPGSLRIEGTNKLQLMIHPQNI